MSTSANSHHDDTTCDNYIGDSCAPTCEIGSVDSSNIPIGDSSIQNIDNEIGLSVTATVFDCSGDIDDDGTNNTITQSVIDNLGLCLDTIEFYYYLASVSSALPYRPVLIQKELPLFRNWVRNDHIIGGLSSQMNAKVWLAELAYENDQYLKSYLRKGIMEGFRIVDDIDSIIGYDSVNYDSVRVGEAAQIVDELLLSEIRDSKYIFSQSKPLCIHSLGAVKKSNGSFRPITDCSRPPGISINSFMEGTAQKFSYQTIDYVSELMLPHSFSATVDISSAYRSVSISPDHWKCQGVRWNILGEDQFLLDTRLCFGIRCAPFIFSQISNFVVRSMARRGFPRVASYLDDFIVFAPTFELCLLAQKVLICLLGSLGFHISWRKCSSPAKRTQYLGVIFDSDSMELRLPLGKLEKLRDELRFFEKKTRASKKQVQKLVGYLAHCARIVRGGRLFSRRIVSLLKGIGNKKRIRIPVSIQLDLNWWRSFMSIFNGSASIIRFCFDVGPAVWTDACSTGYGVYIDRDGDWQAGLFDSQLQLDNLCDRHGHWINVDKPVVSPRDDNVNYWELIAVWQAVRRLANRYVNCHMVIATDNTQVVAMINGNASVNLSCLELLREIFWISVIYNIYVTAKYIPGTHNIIADRLSRLYPSVPISDLRNLFLCCSDG